MWLKELQSKLFRNLRNTSIRLKQTLIIMLTSSVADYASKPVKAAELQAVLDRAKLSLADRADKAAASNIAGAVQEPAAKEQTPAAEPDLDGENPPVEVERLVEISDGDAEQIRELVMLYRTQANEIVSSMETGIRSGSVKEVEQLAHKGLGISANCGMTAVVASFEELLERGRKGDLQGTDVLHAEAVKQLRRIELFLAGYIRSL